MSRMIAPIIFTRIQRGAVDKENAITLANHPGCMTFLRPSAARDSKATTVGVAALPSCILDLAANPVATGPGATINRSIPVPFHSSCSASPNACT